MKSLTTLGIGTVIGAILLLSVPIASGSSRTFDFNNDTGTFDPYGVADENCANPRVPPMFNYPGYSTQTVGFIVDSGGDPVVSWRGCGHGTFGGDFGNDALLTHYFYYDTSINLDNNSQEIRFSWANPADDTSWARVITSTAGTVTPIFQNPTVHIGDGSSIKMKFLVYLLESDQATENYDGQIEVSLILRETGVNVPLGENGGTDTGNLEFVGVDASQTNGTTTPYTPIGGVALTSSGGALTDFQGYAWYEVEWTFGSDNTKVSVTVDGGTPQTLDIAGCINGDGTLSAANNRCTLAGLAIRKPAADDDTKQLFIDIDDIIIDAPGVVDPVAVVGPLSNAHTEVTVNFIDGDTPAENVKLYIDTGSGPALVATAVHGVGGVDFTDGEHTFTGLTLNEDDIVYATQTVSSVEGALSAGVTVLDGLPIEDFSNGLTWLSTAIPTGDDFDNWYTTVNDSFTTASVITYEGSQAMNISDGGWKNGVYRIYESVIPADGTYHVTAKVHINEHVDYPNAMHQYQLGVVVNGTHRDTNCHNWSLAAVDASQPGSAVGNYAGLTSGNDSGLPAQELKTMGGFYAQAGDNLLIVFSSNVETAWKDVAYLAGVDGVHGTCDDRLDEQDGACETSYIAPPFTVCWNTAPNAQGTWNFRANRSSTCATGYANVRIDNIVLKPGDGTDPCELVPDVDVSSGILLAGQTTVTVTGVDAAPDAVTVYDKTASQAIGTLTSGFTGTGTETVTVTALVAGHEIAATQTVGGQEGCPPIGGVVVDDCAQVAPVAVATTDLDNGKDQVTVTGVSDQATDVTVYANGTTVIGSLTVSASGGTEVVTVSPALVKGEKIMATQTIATLEGCVPASGPMVGSGDNTSIYLCLGIRETNPSGAIGTNGGNTGTIEWLGASHTPAPPRGTQILVSDDWQTVTFDPTTDPIVSFNLGDGAFVDAKGVLEHLAVSADPASPDVGPYTLYVDNVTSAGVNFGDVEAVAAGQQAIFRQPSYSATSAGHWLGAPNDSVVVDTVGDNSTKSVRIRWRFTDEGDNHWLRVSTDACPNIPNPIVDLTQPITLRVKLSLAPVEYTLTASVVGGNGTVAPTSGSYVENTDVDLLATPDPGFQVKAWTGTDNDSLKTNANTVKMTSDKVVTVEFEAEPPLCNDPVQDTDNDGDVDLTDFGIFSQCFNGPNRAYAVSSPAELVAKCECIDQDDDGDVDLTDFGVFSSCFNGPNRAPGAGCP